MHSSRKHGFTLIEVIIAISIGSLLILVTSAAIRTGLTYMQRGEERFNKGLKERVALNFLTQQITSIRPYNAGNDAAFFNGDKDFVSFVAPLSLKKYYNYGLMICAYTIAKEDGGTYSLVYSEKRLLSNKYLTELAEEFGEKMNRTKFFKEESIVFFQGCQKITIEYFGGETSDEDKDIVKGKNKEKEEGPWKESWQEEEGLPMAIKITLLKRGETQEAVAPIMVTS